MKKGWLKSHPFFRQKILVFLLFNCYSLLYMQTLHLDQVRALFKLLETESEQYRPVLKQALSAAIKTDPRTVEQVLKEDFAEHAPLPVIQTLEEICWDDLADSLAMFSAKINPDLEEGLSLVAKFTTPTTARGKISQPLDELGKEIRPVLINAKDYREIAQALGTFIFSVKGFMVLPSVKTIRELSFPHFLAKKQGSALCAACLYAGIGLRFGLNLEIVDMAGRILLYWQDETHQDTFTVDPSDNGKILSQDDCKIYLKSRNLSWDEHTFSVLSSRLVVRRFLANMIYILNKLGDNRRLSYLRNYLEIIKN